MRRRAFGLGLLAALAGCTATEPDRTETTADDTGTPTASETPECRKVRCRGREVSLGEDNRKYVFPIRYDRLAGDVQRTADEIVTDGISVCYPPSDSLGTFIDVAKEKTAKQVAEYDADHGGTRLPLYVDTAYLLKAEILFALTILEMDVVVSDGLVGESII